jgi:hypothetical protein
MSVFAFNVSSRNSVTRKGNLILVKVLWIAASHNIFERVQHESVCLSEETRA